MDFIWRSGIRPSDTPTGTNCVQSQFLGVVLSVVVASVVDFVVVDGFAVVEDDVLLVSVDVDAVVDSSVVVDGDCVVDSVVVDVVVDGLAVVEDEVLLFSVDVEPVVDCSVVVDSVVVGTVLKICK